jgi:glycosyltransferase involved in cell wall biosynthesis
MGEGAPVVSVILPVFNGETFLGEALDSVMRQSYRFLDPIVVDDGSSDASAAIARARRGVRLISQPRAGVAAARNAGLAAARGALVAFLDADDRWAPDKLLVQVGHLRRHPSLGFVLGRMINFLEGAAAPPFELRANLFEPQPGYSTGTMLARGEVFRRIGGFDAALAPSETMDWFARAVDAGVPHAIVPHVVLYRRLHGRNTSYDVAATQQRILRLLRASIERKRRAAGDRGRTESRG